jgi:hypothetical protein
MKMDFASRRKIYAVFVVLLMVLLAKLAFSLHETKTLRLDHEFWMSTNTGSADLGTLGNPFICATAGEFDRTMSNLPPDCTVHILAGTYQTLGSGLHPAYELKSGQKILGSGMDVTIIQLVTNAPSGNSVMGSVGRALGIEVSDLTLDCHYIPGVSRNVTYIGLDLNGSRLVARRVKVINLAYLDTSVNSEAWGIGFNSIYAGPFNSDGNIIEECEVSNFVAGTACSAIALNGGCISGIIRDNRVFLQVTNHSLVAINGANMHDTLVEGNYINGAAEGFYGDTGGYTNIILAHNTFKNCIYAVALLHVPRQNITFCFNTITIPTRGGTALWFDSSASYTNIVIAGNDVGFDGPSAPGSLFLDANNVRGLVVHDNTVDPGLANVISGCTGVSIYNNYDQEGNFLTSLNQVVPPNGITRTTVTATSYKAGYADEYIGVRYNGTIIYLPSAVGHAGKEFIIADETGLSAKEPILIRTTSPNIINGDSYVLITNSYGAKTVISDGTNWFAH